MYHNFSPLFIFSFTFVTIRAGIYREYIGRAKSAFFNAEKDSSIFFIRSKILKILFKKKDQTNYEPCLLFLENNRSLIKSQEGGAVDSLSFGPYDTHSQKEKMFYKVTKYCLISTFKKYLYFPMTMRRSYA